MKPDLHRYLDGEISRDALAPELRERAQQWDALLAAGRAAPDAPDWLAARIMSEIHAAPVRVSVFTRAWQWLVRPHSFTVRPLSALALGVAALAIAVWPRERERIVLPQPVPVAQGRAPASSVVYVQFAYAADDASSVAIAGDFNDWDAQRAQLRDDDGDGVWTGLVAVQPGEHDYMFVVNGSDWVTDPHAERYADDGFGMRNARIAVADPRDTNT